MKVACVGEAMVELSLDATGSAAQVGYAGDTLNTAIYLKRTAPALDVAFVTRLGRDDFSARLTAFISAQGVSVDRIETSDTRRVGLYAITTDAAGERSFTYWRDTSAAREMFQSDNGLDFSALEGFDVILLTAITLAILPDATRSELCKWLGQFRANGGRVAFDSNYRPTLWKDRTTAQAEIARLWEMCDIALPSADDEAAIYGDKSVDETVARLRSAGVAEGALKHGSNGPISLGETISASYTPAQRVVDTTAAGDSFNGGYLGARLIGASQSEALQAGHKLAAHVVGHKGAIAPEMS